MSRKRVALISCVSQKLTHEAPAEEFYVSSLFKKNLEWAKLRKFDEIYILSAEYGLVELKHKLKPYDKTLNKMAIKDRKVWAENVYGDLLNDEDLDDTTFTFLAGTRYREFLADRLPYTEVPMRGLQIGKQLRWLTNQINTLKQVD